MSNLTILAFDTSTEYLSVALICHSIDSRNQVEFSCSQSFVRFYFSHFYAPTSSSREIISVIGQLIDAAGLTLDSIDAIAYGKGPGSFTGLRIAAGVAQGLGYATGLPLIAVDSLLASAEFARLCQAEIILPKVNHSCSLEGKTYNQEKAILLNSIVKQNTKEVQQFRVTNLSMSSKFFYSSLQPTRNEHFTVLVNRDARMGEVYWAIYSFSSRDGAWSEVVSPTVCSVIKVDRDKSIDFFIGNRSIEISNIFNQASVPCVSDAVPHAISVANLAVRSYLNQLITNPFDALPTYLRNRVALTKEERLLGVKK